MSTNTNDMAIKKTKELNHRISALESERDALKARVAELEEALGIAETVLARCGGEDSDSDAFLSEALASVRTAISNAKKETSA